MIIIMMETMMKYTMGTLFLYIIYIYMYVCIYITINSAVFNLTQNYMQ